MKLAMANLLVVDDELGMRQFLTHLFQREGHVVRVAGSGTEALAQIQQQAPDLIISDVRMPDMSGVDLLRAAKQQLPDVEVIMMTAFANVDTAREAFLLGAYDFVQKPFDNDLLKETVTRALEDENHHRLPGTPRLTVEARRVGDRPSGLTPRTHPLVQAAVGATRAVGHKHQLACASTDANVPIALGVPAVALGAGGRAGDAHLPTEWYENDKGALGIVRALLVTAAMAAAS